MEKELILLLIGCVTFATLEAFLILRKRDFSIKGIIVFIPLTENTNNLEYIIRELLYRILQSQISVTILMCDYGADKETLDICSRLIKENSNFCLVKPKDVEKIIAKLK